MIESGKKVEISSDFKQAVNDYLLFLEKSYPQKALLKIIGDRYKLNKSQRSVLFRGIVKRETAFARRKKKVPGIKDCKVYIDSYNVILTIANYLYGRTVYISNDSFSRDTGEVHGRSTLDNVFIKSTRLLLLLIP